MPKSIYLSAALFSVAERDFNGRLGRALEEAGFKVVLPQDFDQWGDQSDLFNLNLSALASADAVLAVVDGTDVDSGVAWEMGYAFARGIPVISLRTDFRLRSETETSAINLMLDRGSTEYVAALEEPLDKAVKAAKRVLDPPVAEAV